ncbi:MAG: radical SAM family heme chaperone HemW [Bacteroidetes bacterium]|nr:radical SAM family heme chaperone HemW [Bacteroidota bacterium]
MAGIYIHIPFCRRKCHYCNFFSLASQKLKEPFLAALKKEIVSTREYLGGEPVNTIYFGGGTPSVYRPGELQEVFTSPPDPSPEGEGGSVSRDRMEITLELNPDDVTEAYVAELKKTWFNRFSLGVQSFDDEDLLYLNRSHSAGQAVAAVKRLQEAGYENISIDLIYGIPGAGNGRWLRNLETAFSLGVPHISAYALTVESNTPLAWMISRKKSAPVSDEAQVEQFRILMEQARQNGFQQYEISNFCKPGWHAIHNTNYWNGVPYLGLGPSAHSYNGSSRRWNVSSLSKYIGGIDKGECIYEEEVLTDIQKYNEYVMTSLRTMWGCNLGKINYELRITNYELIGKRAAAFVQQGWLTENSGVYFLTDEGKLFADRIAGELFL